MEGNSNIGTTIDPRSELDSHANMILFGKDCFVFDGVPGKTCCVTPYDPSLKTKERRIPIVDAAVAYDCPYSHKTFILIGRNILHVSTLDHNLLPPFILREAGLVVNDKPKIHSEKPTVDDHSIYAPDSDLRIPLKLNGIFSYFHTRKPTPEEIQNCHDHIVLTPEGDDWDPYSTHYAINEESMLDWEGNMKDKRFWKSEKQTKIDIDDDPYISSMSISDYERHIDEKLNVTAKYIDAESKARVKDKLTDDDEVAELASLLAAKAEVSSTAIAIGSTGVGDASDDLFVDAEEDSLMEMDDDDDVIPDGNLNINSVELKDLVNDYDIEDLGEPITYQLDELDESNPIIASLIAKPASKLTAKFLSKIWQIKHEEAVKVLDQTTQLCRQGADNTLSKQYSTNDRMLRYRRINSVFYTDTFFVTAKAKSTRGNKCAQIFVSDKGYVAIYPMKSKGEFLDALKLFCKDVGVPVTMVMDPSGEQTSPAVKAFCHKVGTTYKFLQEATQWANRAELYVGLFKESIRKDLRRTNAPAVLWDYCAERRARINNVTPKPLFQLQGVSAHVATLGTTPDISNLCVFDWYEWCYFREENPKATAFPYQKVVLGRVLGPMKNEGNEMVQAVLKANGQIVPRRTCRPLRDDELHSKVEQLKREEFDREIKKRLGDSIHIVQPVKPEADQDPLAEFQNCDDDEEPPPPEVLEDPVDATGQAVYEQPFTDILLNAEVLLPHQGEEMKRAKVKRRSKDQDGDLIGTYDANPLLNTMVYDVEFDDGTVREYSANIIAQNMYAQVDENGRSQSILQAIVDHHVYTTHSGYVHKKDKWITTRSGQKRLRKSTAGWSFLVQWRDGEEQWVPLRILKESNPIEVAEYVVANGIEDEAAFCWWVPYTLKKRDSIISAVNARVARTTHKYGIEVPRTVQEAKEIDDKNKNRFWQDAIDKEMRNVAVAFKILERGASAPVGYTPSSGHLVFDVKMDFTRKARWVKDGHKTVDPENSTFAGVVSRESVRIALTYAALNDIDVTVGDIQNAYLQAPSSEKHYIICGDEFGLEHSGKIAIIERALYGGKASGADFWRHLRTCMHHLGFEPCKADSEVWMRPAMKENGDKHWEYVLLYVDDVLCISMNGKDVINNEIGKYFYIKPGSVGPPDIYLGNKLTKVVLENGKYAWAMSSSQYVQNAVKNIEKYMQTKGLSLPKKANAPFPNDYRPEIDISTELNASEAAHYQSIIGILRWIVELGRADITAEASMMASCLALPRKGHLDCLYHMLSYLKNKHNSEMVFDPTEPEIDDIAFQKENWEHSVYSDVKEIIPKNAPESRGIGFKIRAYVDSDHAGSEITRRSRSGYMVFLNNAPIYWTSKKQGSIMTSSFASEFIAMKDCCEYLRGLRYKLRMMGIPCEFPSYIFGDNKSVLVNSSVPTSTLKKKHCSIAYHFVREGVAADEWRVTYISTHDNVADLLTKPLSHGEKRMKFVRMFLHHL